MSALCVDVDTTVDSSCLSPDNHENYESRGATFSHCTGDLDALGFPKQTTDCLLRALFFPPNFRIVVPIIVIKTVQFTKILRYPI